MSSLASKPVLIVDPDAQMRAVIASMLADAGMLDVVMAPNVAEAKNALCGRPPGAMIVETSLPDGDGVDLLAWVRRHPESPAADVPVLILTRQAQPGLIQRARNAGAHGVLVKPVTAQNLLTKFERMLDDPRPFVNSDVYVGPCRRVRIVESRGGGSRTLGTDEPQNDPRLCNPAHCAILATEVEKVARCAKNLSLDQAAQLKAVRTCAARVATSAEEAGDRPVAIAARSLLDILDASEARGVLNAEIVEIHIATLRNLTNAERRRGRSDREVISGLHALVARELQAA